MTTSRTAARRRGRIFRALQAYSEHTAATYLAVWSPATQRVTPPRAY
jgi:hypothetical protein